MRCNPGFVAHLFSVAGTREIHPLDPQPHRHRMLVPRVCAPRVTRCSLGKYWSRDFFQQAAGSQSWGTQVIYDSYSGRQRNLMMHAQCPLPVYYSQLGLPSKSYDFPEKSLGISWYSKLHLVRELWVESITLQWTVYILALITPYKG